MIKNLENKDKRIEKICNKIYLGHLIDMKNNSGILLLMILLKENCLLKMIDIIKIKMRVWKIN